MRGARLSAFDGTGNCFLRSRTSACERLQLSDLIDSVLFFPSERPSDLSKRQDLRPLQSDRVFRTSRLTRGNVGRCDIANESTAIRVRLLPRARAPCAFADESHQTS